MMARPKVNEPHTSAASQKTAPLQVIVALDATPHSALVIENLHRFLTSQNASIDFLNVLPDGPTDDRKFEAFDEEAQQEAARIVSEEFDKYTALLESQQFKINNRNFIRNADSVEEGILQHIDLQQPDLLILGMHEKASLRKGWRISSTSYSIATHAPCSVLILKQPKQQAQRLKVLFATDGSAHADQAAQSLIRFLPQFTTEIIITSVVSVNSYVLPVVEPFVDYTPLERAIQGEAQNILNRTRTMFENAGFSVTDEFFNLGDPVDQILNEAQEHQVDLIAVGSHGSGGRLARWLLGSVSSKILEYSHASVAILR